MREQWNKAPGVAGAPAVMINAMRACHAVAPAA